VLLSKYKLKKKSSIDLQHTSLITKKKHKPALSHTQQYKGKDMKTMKKPSGLLNYCLEAGSEWRSHPF
jgi:hypothetical protein